MSNLNIKVGSKWLDIPSDAILKIKRVNNIFYDSKQRRSFSLNVALPLSPMNNIVLGWLFDIGIPNATSNTTDCELYDGNQFVQNAVLTVSKSATRYLCSVALDYGTVDVLSDETNIRDIPDFIGSGQELTTSNSGTYPAANLATYYFMNMAGSRPETEESLTDNWMSNHASLYLMVILRVVMTYNGWRGDTMSGSFMDDPELQQLHFLNFYLPPGTTTAGQYWVETLPDLTVKDLLESLSLMFAAGMFYDNASKEVRFELLKDLLDKTPIDWSHKVARDSFERDWSKSPIGSNGVTFKWNSKYYSMYKQPDTSQNWSHGWQDNETWLLANNGDDGEMVKITTDNTAFVWKATSPLGNASWFPEIYLGFVSEDFNLEDCIGTVNTHYDLGTLTPIEGDMAFCEWENWFFIYDGSQWNKAAYHNHSLKKGDGSKTLTSVICAPISDHVGDDLNTANIRNQPIINKHGIKQVARDGEAENAWDDLPPLLMFHRGVGYDDNGDDYYLNHPSADPYRELDFSSPDIYDASFNKVGNYRLTWDGDAGLYNQFHQEWYDYVSNGQEVSFMANLTLQDIIDLDLSVPIHVHGAEGFIREIQYELPLTKPVKVTFVKKA